MHRGVQRLAKTLAHLVSGPRNEEIRAGRGGGGGAVLCIQTNAIVVAGNMDITGWEHGVALTQTTRRIVLLCLLNIPC